MIKIPNYPAMVFRHSLGDVSVFCTSGYGNHSDIVFDDKAEYGWPFTGHTEQLTCKLFFGEKTAYAEPECTT